jgi:hypothetical protein
VKKKKTITILILIAIVFGLALYYMVNPLNTAFTPKCMFHSLTGWNCPGCGMQRFLHAFMHGRFLEAISYNYMLVILIPYIILFGIEKLFLTGETQKRWQNVIEGRNMAICLCIVAPGWFIIRNILHI